MYKKYILIKLLLWLIPCSLLAQINVSDSQDGPVAADAPAQRIVSLAPHITENLYRIGAGGQLVATVEYSDYPAPARRLPRVGSYNRLNLEQVIALEPDLVIAWEAGTPPLQLARLEQFGIRVVRDNPTTFAELAAALRRLGELTGHGPAAEALAREVERRSAQVRDANRLRPPVKLFYQLWQQPLMTLNQTQLIHHMIETCGAVNPFARRPEAAPRINLEAVLAANPDLIVAGVRSGQEAQGLPDDWQQFWQPWSQITAVREQLLFSVPTDLTHRPTLRALEGMEQICAAVEQARNRLAGEK